MGRDRVGERRLVIPRRHRANTLSLSHAQLIHSPQKPPERAVWLPLRFTNGNWGRGDLAKEQTEAWLRRPHSQRCCLGGWKRVAGGPWHCLCCSRVWPDVWFSQVQPSITEETLSQRSQEQRVLCTLRVNKNEKCLICSSAFSCWSQAIESRLGSPPCRGRSKAGWGVGGSWPRYVEGQAMSAKKRHRKGLRPDVRCCCRARE